MSAEEYHFELPLKDERELRLFVKVAFGVEFPDRKVCPNHTTPWKAFSDAYFAREPVSIWKGSRGLGGKTFMLGTLGNTEAVTLGADVTVLGGSGQQSQRVLETSHRLWSHGNAPRFLLRADPTSSKLRLTNGGRIVALQASQRSARGAHPQRLRLDEIDEMDWDILKAALGQPMDRPGIPSQVVMSSTHQYMDKSMSLALDMALERGWPVYEWCFRETEQPHGWLSSAQIAETKRRVPEAMWLNEYMLQEPSIEGRAINTDAVKRMFRRELGVFEGGMNKMCEPSAPGALPKLFVYAHGADWAKLRNWSILVTLRVDERPMRVVSFERLGRIPYPLMIKHWDERIARMPGEARHDMTGVGVVVEDFRTQPAEGVMITGQNRTHLLADYVAAVENDEIISPFIAYMEREHRLATYEMLYGQKHAPDSIVAMALAYRAAQAMIGMQVGPESMERQSYWRMG